MFAFKQFMIVDKITQWDRVIVNKYCARWGRWHFVGKFRVEDTEAYQEMIRMNYKTLREILTAILVILPFAVSVWACFWKYCWPKNYHSLLSARSNGKNCHQLSCGIWTYPNYMVVDDIQWYSMTVYDSTSSCSNARDGWKYHPLSWPFKRGLTIHQRKS